MRKINHDMKKRKTEKFFIKNISTERYKNSAIPAMQRALNEEEFNRRKLLIDNDTVPREHCFFNPISVKIQGQRKGRLKTTGLLQLENAF